MKYSRTQWWLPKLLCLIAACAFWVYVMNEQNPVMENTYTIPVEVRNLDRSIIPIRRSMFPFRAMKQSSPYPRSSSI